MQYIWCLGPWLKAFRINCMFLRSCLSISLASVCGPCAETCGLYFSKMKVRYQKIPNGGDDDDVDSMNV